MEGIDLHLVHRGRHLVEGLDVHQAVGVEVAHADRAQPAGPMRLFHRAPRAVHVAERLVTRWMHLSTLVVVTNTDGALAAEAVGPEAADVDIGLWHADVGEQKPGTKDWLGENVKHSIGDDLLVNIHVAAAVSNAPDAR